MPLPVKRVLLAFRLSLPQTITSLVEPLASRVKGPGQRRQVGQVAVPYFPTTLFGT